MHYYMDGKKYNYTLNNEGIIVSSVEDSTITVIDGMEYPVLPNAPEPFVYGVKTICTMYYGDRCNLYDVRTGTYSRNQPFKGISWVDEIYTSPSTLPIEHQSLPVDDTVELPKEEV